MADTLKQESKTKWKLPSIVLKNEFYIGIIVFAVIVLIILFATGTIGEGMSSWTSPDYKLLNKSHTGQTRRSDNKNDNWSRKDMIESVSRFNRIAAE